MRKYRSGRFNNIKIGAKANNNNVLGGGYYA